MPRVSRLKLPPLDGPQEPLGERIARLRKERGYSQAELAARIGIIQALVSDYETGKLRLSAEMAVRFARALEVSADELLQPSKGKRRVLQPSRKVLRRLEQIETLPPTQQTTLFRTIDTFLENAVLKSARR
jgi:transcriptional regulator with XRE-family HTH domain